MDMWILSGVKRYSRDSGKSGTSPRTWMLVDVTVHEYKSLKNRFARTYRIQRSKSGCIAKPILRVFLLPAFLEPIIP